MVLLYNENQKLACGSKEAFADDQSRRSGRLHLSGELAKPKVLTEG